MIKGVHTMFYSSDPEATRAFLRDQLGLRATDVGGGWLIFGFKSAETGVHPVEGAESSPAGTHQFSFYCDDIETTVATLKARGVEFQHDVKDAGWGLVTTMKVPGGCEVQLYQPRYEMPE